MPRARGVSHATLVPLGQPEKAMGHESPIEPWLAPDNRAACGLRTDWLRRTKAMKTAGRENQKRCVNGAASRVLGTERQNNPAQTRRAGRQEKIQPQEKCFLLDSFYRTYQELRRPNLTWRSNRAIARPSARRATCIIVYNPLPAGRTPKTIAQTCERHISLTVCLRRSSLFR